MSILLDALRKSEEQRQLGSAPTLSGGLESRAGGDGTEHQWLPLSMMALSAILMAWIGWKQFSEPLTVERSVGPGPAVAITATESGVDSAFPETAVDAANAADDTAVADLPPSGPDQQTDRRQQLSQAVTDFEAEVQPQPGDTSRTGATAETDADPGARLAAQTPPGDGAEAATPSSEPAVPEPISYWEVPQSVRESMPEFRITVLVYAPQPEDRFLLINGERLGEQDTLGGGVRLEEIRRDGAVFVYRKYRFLVKG